MYTNIEGTNEDVASQTGAFGEAIPGHERGRL